jgi:predicted NBD/HSP70 family sugar kinase
MKAGIKIADQWLRQVLEILYRKRDLSRGEIGESTGLNAASASYALRYLLDRGTLVKRAETQSAGRRRREVFNLNSEAGYFIGVDLEGDRIRFALTNFVGDICCRWEVPLEFRQPLDPRVVVDGIRKVSLDPIRRDRILAIGVSYPGLLDVEGRLIAVNLGWNRCPLVQELRTVFPWPVFLESDKHSCIVAENWLGAAQGRRNALFLIAEGGIGLGVLLDGRPLSGLHAVPGEIGHWKILPDAPDLCNCGATGCLEAIASSPNVVRQYAELCGVPKEERAGIRVVDVFERARQGDAAAAAVLQRAGRALGLALSHAIALLNPEVVILGGDLIGAEDILVPIVLSEIRQRTLPVSLEGLKIVISSLGLDIRLKGAASLAFRKMLEDPLRLRSMCTLDPAERSATALQSPRPDSEAALPGELVCS